MRTIQTVSAIQAAIITRLHLFYSQVNVTVRGSTIDRAVTGTTATDAAKIENEKKEERCFHHSPWATAL